MATELWFDKMKLVASFGGAKFYVDTVEYSAGRHIKKHTFDKDSVSGRGKGGGPVSVGKFVDKVLANGVASSEEQFVEDLGAAPKQFIVNGYFLESNLEFGMPDYLKARDLFIKKMSEGQTRTLILPTFGEIAVRPGKLTTRFSNKEGGIETFKAVFHRAITNYQPFFTEDTKSTMDLEADELLEILLGMMENTLSVTEPPPSVTTAGIPGVFQIPDDIGLSNFVAEDTTSLLDRFRDKVATYTGYGQTKLAELNAFQQELNGFSNSITELILAPSELASSMTAIVQQLSNIFVRPLDAFLAQKDLLSTFTDGLSDIIGDTLDAFSLRSNQNSISWLSQNAAGAEMMRMASDIDFDSSEQAIDVRDDITDLINDLQLENAEVMASVSPYGQMRTTLAASVSDLTQRSASLPLVEDLQLDDSLPLLVVAYGLYEDATRFEAMSTRNEVENNLVPKTDLEVLSI